MMADVRIAAKGFLEVNDSEYVRLVSQKKTKYKNTL